MKKFISLMLALVLTLGLATTAFADNYTDDKSFTITTSTAEGTTGSGSDYTWNIDVTAGLDAPTQEELAAEGAVAANYYVVVEWDVESSLVFTYGIDAFSWNVYSDVDNKVDATNGDAKGAGYEVDYSMGKWEGEATIDVTVTNWSNRELTAKVAFQGAAADADKGIVTAITVKEGATAITNPTLTIKSAAENVAIVDGETTTSAATGQSQVKLDATTLSGAINKADATIGTVTVTLVGLDTASKSEETTAAVTPAEPQG